MEETCSIACATLANNPYDIPFALLYLITENQHADLAATTANLTSIVISPQGIDLSQEKDDWYLTQVHQTGQPVLITNLTERLEILPIGVWPDSPHSALVMPIAKAGFLIMGISPRLEFDDDYRGFFDLVANSVATAIAKAEAYEAERKRAEALAELDRAKTTFFSNVSHEFRTPLTLMLSPLEDILSNPQGLLPPSDRERLEVAYRNSQRLLKLVNTLLDFSRIEAGRIEAIYEPTNLAMLTVELAGVFRSVIEQAGMRLRVDCPPLPEPIYVDCQMWEKIVLNLLSNAFKFTLQGEISVILRYGNDHITLEVRDTGIGIPTEEIPHIFKRFHRVKGMRGRSYEGSGIGLSLVQELVRLHSGTIEVNSVVNQGTRFIVSIPTGCSHLPSERLRRSRTSTITSVSPYLEEALRWLPEQEHQVRSNEDISSLPIPLHPFSISAHILIADDNADIRNYLKRLLSQHYEVETVADGVAAKVAINQQIPDLLITDVMMPELDGFELLRSLRSDPQTQDLPIILLSARAGEESRIEGLKAGADDYLIKPFSARELLARVEATLKLAQLRKEARQQEQALRQEAEAAYHRIHQLLEHMGDAFVELDRDWRIIYQNAQAEKINKKSRSEVLGKTNWQEWPASVGTNIEHQFRRAMSEQIPVHFEHHYYAPPDYDLWVEIQAYPSENGLCIFFRDISERKLAEAKLQALNQDLTHRVNELQTLFELLPIGVAIAENPDCKTIRVNPYLAELIRIGVNDNASIDSPPEERPAYRICREGQEKEIPVDDLPMQYAAIHKTEVRNEVVDLIHPDGTVVKLLCYASPLLDEEGNVRGVLGGFVDITQRVLTETALRESEDRLLFALTAAQMVAWDWDLTNDICYRSGNASEILGLNTDKPDDFYQMVHPEDRATVEEATTRAIRGEALYDLEFRLITPDGRTLWVADKARLRYDHEGKPSRLTGVCVNITARKQAEIEREQLLQREQVLRSSAESAEAKLQELLASIQEDFVLLDHHWCIAYLNPQAAETMRKPREEVIGQSIWELFPNLVETEFYHCLHQVRRDQTPTQFEYYYSTWDCWFENRVYPAPDGVVVLCTNITNRKRRELKERFLNQLDLQLRQLSNSQAIIETTVNSLGQYLEVNRCTLSKIEWQQDLMTIEPDWCLNMPSSAGTYSISDFMAPEFQAVIASGQPAVVYDVTKDSRTATLTGIYERFQVKAFASIPCIYQGHWVAVLSVNSKTPRVWREDEITLLQEIVARVWPLIEQTRAVEALHQSEAQFRQLANAMPQIVWVTNGEGQLEFINERWEEYTGLTLEQTLDLQSQTHIIPAKDLQQMQVDFARALETASPYKSQFRLIRPDDTYLYFLVRAVPIKDDRGRLLKWFGTSTDISELKQLEIEREKLLQQEQAAREEAERANRIKDEFLAVLSHELRSPLNPILGWAKLLQSSKLDEATTKQALATIERNAKLQAELIEDLLDVSRILRGKLSLTVSPINLALTIKAALETMRLAAEAKSIKIELMLDSKVGQVSGDPTRLQQVVWNLLSNAVKFTPSGGQVQVRLEESDNQAQITVRDNGKGINPDFLPYVFDYFRQADSTTTRKFGGLGLGLAIVRHLVQLHGGTIEAESKGEGLGATFTVRLPLMLLQPTVNPDCQSPISFDLRDIQVLVIDDDTDTRDFIAFLLKQAGAKVITAASADEALTALTQSQPNIILSDIGMPEMDGYMLMRQIRTLPSEQGGQIKAIALTAYAGEFDRQQALSAGFDKHISKPIDPTLLITAIANLIRS